MSSLCKHVCECVYLFFLFSVRPSCVCYRSLSGYEQPHKPHILTIRVSQLNFGRFLFLFFHSNVCVYVCCLCSCMMRLRYVVANTRTFINYMHRRVLKILATLLVLLRFGCFWNVKWWFWDSIPYILQTASLYSSGVLSCTTCYL